jgi:hypothetical protein
MIMRLLNIVVIAALVLAAADVYKIKFESTSQAQRVAKLRMEIRREHDVIAALRAEWSRLDNPARIQDLTRRHLPLKPVEGRQFDRLDQLPDRPPDLVPLDDPDPIRTVLAKPEFVDRTATGAVPGQPGASRPPPRPATSSAPARPATSGPPTASSAPARPVTSSASARPATSSSPTVSSAPARPATSIPPTRPDTNSAAAWPFPSSMPAQHDTR